MQVYQDGIFLDIALLEDLFHNFLAGERAFFLQNFPDDILDHAGHITPFGKGVETAADEYETLVFD